MTHPVRLVVLSERVRVRKSMAAVAEVAAAVVAEEEEGVLTDTSSVEGGLLGDMLR